MGAFVPVSATTMPPVTACGIIHTFHIGQMPPKKTQAIILICDSKHPAGCAKVTKEQPTWYATPQRTCVHRIGSENP